MPNSKPHVHKRSDSGGAMCGRGGKHPRLTAYTDEVTCTYCALGVTGVSGHSVHPLPASRWAALRAEIQRERDDRYAAAARRDAAGSFESAGQARAFADGLRWVLALMDKLEAAPAAAGEKE